MIKEILIQDSSGEILTIRNIKNISRQRSTGVGVLELDDITIEYYVMDDRTSTIVLDGSYILEYDVTNMGMVILSCTFDSLSIFSKHIQKIRRLENLQKVKEEKNMADTAKNKRMALACVLVNGNKTFESFDVDEQAWRSMTTYEAAEYLNYIYPEVSIENFVRLLKDVFYQSNEAFTFRTDSETIIRHVAIELIYVSSKNIEFVLGTFQSVQRKFTFLSYANPETFRINEGLTQNRILTLYFKSGEYVTFERVYDVEYPTLSSSLTFRYYDYVSESFVEADFDMTNILGHTLTVEEGE